MPYLFFSLKRIKAHSAYGGFLETNTALKRALHDLLSRGVRGQLKREQVASAVAEMVVARPEIGSLIVDVLCLSDLETMSKKVKRTLHDTYNDYVP